MAWEGKIQDFPEFRMDREELLNRARSYDWYHTMKLDDSFTSSGMFNLEPFRDYYMLPRNLSGVRCLEIGAGNGYWPIELERRGAASVLATDLANFADTDFSVLHGQEPICKGRSGPGDFGQNFRAAAVLLGSKVEYKLLSCYDLRREALGGFDLVWCGSMLLHLQGPQLALRRMAEVCDNVFFTSTETAMELDGTNHLRFMGDRISYVHFIPSPSCLVSMIRACGYEKVLRGPSFDLTYHKKKGEPVPHTTCIGLKSAAHSAVAIQAPRIYEEGERACSITLHSPPMRGPRPDDVSLILKVTNRSNVDWRTDGEAPIELLADESVRGGFWAPKEKTSVRQAILPDILPAGLYSYVRVILDGKRMRKERATFRPVLRQGNTVFDCSCDPIRIPKD